jgi:hypothetical protein
MLIGISGWLGIVAGITQLVSHISAVAKRSTIDKDTVVPTALTSIGIATITRVTSN